MTTDYYLIKADFIKIHKFTKKTGEWQILVRMSQCKMKKLLEARVSGQRETWVDLRELPPVS